MKTWIVVLLIGIGIFIAGAAIPIDKNFGFSGMYVIGLGILLIIASLVAAGRRLMHRMEND